MNLPLLSLFRPACLRFVLFGLAMIFTTFNTFTTVGETFCRTLRMSGCLHLAPSTRSCQPEGIM